MNFWRCAEYLSTSTASRLLLDDNQVDESSLVSTIIQYFTVHDHGYRYQADNFKPEEFKSGRVGGHHCIDLVGRANNGTGPIKRILEVKLLLDDSQSSPKRLVADVLRLASIRTGIPKGVKRYFVAVGSDSRWDSSYFGLRGIFSNMCAYSYVPAFTTMGLTAKKVSTSLYEGWQETHEDAVEPYLRPHLPKSIKTQLVGLHTHKPDPVVGGQMPSLTARIWRIFPGPV